MPQIKTVSVTYGRKFNLGNYNSATVDCTIWADVGEEENLDETMFRLWSMAKNNVKAQSQSLPLQGQPNTNIQEMFLGLPVEVVDAH